MPRRKYKKTKRNVEDPRYNDLIVGETINCILKDGKKSLAERLIYDTFDKISEKTGKDPLEIFHLAVKNVSPAVQVKSRRVGGATYQVPIEIAGERKRALAINWLLDYARARTGSGFSQRFCDEILEASDNKGGAVKKKMDTHKMAEANKAFSHYRF